MTVVLTPVEQAFEQLGLIRERLTRLQDVVADIEDAALSMQIRSAMRTNTTALERASALLSRQRTDPADADLDSQHVGGTRGG